MMILLNSLFLLPFLYIIQNTLKMRTLYFKLSRHNYQNWFRILEETISGSTSFQRAPSYLSY